MASEQKISFDEFAQRKNLSPRIKAAFAAHLMSRGRIEFRPASEWESSHRLFLSADRRRK